MGPFYSDLDHHRLFDLCSDLCSDLEASAPADHPAAVDSADLVYLIDSDPADPEVAAGCSAAAVDRDCFGYGQF